MRLCGIVIIIVGVLLMALNGYVAGPKFYPDQGSEQMIRNEQDITWAIWVGGAALLAGLALIFTAYKRQ